MLAWTVGIVLILGGTVWGLLSMFAAGMADRSTTWWESTGTPLMGLLPIALGVAIIVWR